MKWEVWICVDAETDRWYRVCTAESPEQLAEIIRILSVPDDGREWVRVRVVRY